ncbi:GNAT family N-acetyltransferase [Paenarthrobacter aurescens]|uniref:N-acetyltransferase n=1 Tax=Paenarthrobacter aurescens TaxID=43663 RepID=A0A4Y3NFY2_PAEAU|nr:GNAT family N-acetyltransferase [Paenarthrobacter aurescens]MDO6144369.1 GNAT family N-acetyltransferase [Paenarthrobacter aurescens]MDO6148216.1 GNAT family N-acetyltransferase [Paenarthrobacter aurescens]MDO6159460.1 GNAT family N-acetyltransferase [Paenarthrobacter aurescens]MDO6163443.1 GNAT family N-acetyltransferase [Paenarthrobacter aurescens]GEB17931.1 N-acetyltransferase [Paenarthrobacter aurescens]
MSSSNSHTLEGLSVEPVEVPESPDASGSPDFRAFHDLDVAHHMDLWGNLDRCSTLAESVLFWRGNEYEERHVFLARLNGTPVGSGTLTLPLSENTTTAGVDVLVDPAYRRRGIGSEILGMLEQQARGRERVSFDAFCAEPLDLLIPGAGLLEAKSGTGGVPLDSASTGFALHHGYSLEQVETNSTLDLPVKEALLQDLEEQALKRAGGYSITGWQDRCPDELVDVFASLKSLMSTEVPIAGLGWEGEDWDARRVRLEESTWLAGGIASTVAVARHDATGELAAYTTLTHREATPGMVYQEDTLVAPGHRGHGLGMLVKIANLRRTEQLWPAATSVMTWNANENRHMLAINIALGFKPSGFDGEWQKRLE